MRRGPTRKLGRCSRLLFAILGNNLAKAVKLRRSTYQLDPVEVSIFLLWPNENNTLDGNLMNIENNYIAM